jgi:hypothetical protein
MNPQTKKPKHQSNILQNKPKVNSQHGQYTQVDGINDLGQMSWKHILEEENVIFSTYCNWLFTNLIRTVKKKVSYPCTQSDIPWLSTNQHSGIKPSSL